ncbi:MAG: hypothetical protein E7386_09170 [Ruminococcaceae bacterium]|nr:hypothetical protein [Oscillospiraceae bacterium]
MAITERKTKAYKKNKPVAYFDRDLMDVLNAGRRSNRRNYTFRQNSIIPTIEPLIIDRKTFGKVKKAEPKQEEAKKETDEKNLSYREVQENSIDYANDHMDRELTEAEKKKLRKLTARKFFEASVSVLLVVLTGFFVMLLLFPQTELSELARDNSNLKDDINTVKRMIVDAEENANGITDMDAVRAQALQLGMQDPNQNQVVNLPISNNDSLKTVVPYDTYGVNDDVLRVNQDALEEYYATHPGR